MQEKIFKAKVLDKEKVESGLLFKTTKYYVILEIEDLETKVQRRRLSLEQFYQYKIGDKFDLYLYSVDDQYWFFSEEEALRH